MFKQSKFLDDFGIWSRKFITDCSIMLQFKATRPHEIHSPARRLDEMVYIRMVWDQATLPKLLDPQCPKLFVRPGTGLGGILHTPESDFA